VVIAVFTVQFYADIKDRTIVIPQKEAALLPKKVKVILMVENDQHKDKSVFDAIKLRTSNFKFNREAANER